MARVLLTLDLSNPSRPGKFDTYLALEGAEGAVWFYDGRHLPQRGSWRACSRGLPLPAKATNTFTLPLAKFADGSYRWHTVLTDAGTYRVMASAATEFTIGEGGTR